MKHTLLIPLLLFALLFSFPFIAQAQTYEDLWSRAQKNSWRNYPDSVIRISTQIIEKAEAENNSAEMFRAMLVRHSYQKKKTPDSLYVHLKELERREQVTKNPKDKAILNTLIADLYTNYAMLNLWKMKKHSNIKDEYPDDIREWGKNMLINKIIYHTEKALSDSLLLLSASNDEYIPFVYQSEIGAYYQHDLYHVVAISVIEMLRRVVNSTEDPEKQQINRKIQQIYSGLKNISSQRNSREGLLLSTLAEAEWKRKSHLLNKDEYASILNKLIATYSDLDLCAEVYYTQIYQLIVDRQYELALTLTNETLRKYAGYHRIKHIETLKEHILSPSFYIASEVVAYPNSPFALNVNFRNVTGFTANVYKENTDTLVSSTYIELNPGKDCAQKDTVVYISSPCEGRYVCKFSHNEAIQDENNDDIKFVSTRLKLLRRNLPNNMLEMMVVDARSGNPVEGADVLLWKNEKGVMTEQKSIKTKKDGKASVISNKDFEYASAVKHTDSFMHPSEIYSYKYDSHSSDYEVKIFTDRVIYRPGQTIHVKGIVYTADKKMKVWPGKKIKLVFADYWNKEIWSKEVTTNSFGSFSVDIPLSSSSVITGEFTIRTDNWERHNIKIEEYKKPTFEVLLDTIKTNLYAFGDSLQVTGKAHTYTGVSLKNTTVNYKISRGISYWSKYYYKDEKLLAKGQVRSNNNGTFSIPTFLERGDEQLHHSYYKGFYVYIIEAVITNEAGETQTASLLLPVADQNLLLSTIARKINKDKDVQIVFEATNPDGASIALEGTYALYQYAEKEENKIGNNPVDTGTFLSNQDTKLPNWKTLQSGKYKLKLSAKDHLGREVKYEKDLLLFSPKADLCPPVYSKFWYYPIVRDFDAEHPAEFILGTSCEDVCLFMDVFSGNKHLESTKTQMSNSIKSFKYPYKKEYGAGISIVFSFVKDGKLHQEKVTFRKRTPEEKLIIQRKSFRDKMYPGQKEEWSFSIRNQDNSPVSAEMLATMYDASLDQIYPDKQSFDLRYMGEIPYARWAQARDRGGFYRAWFKNAQGAGFYPIFYDHFVTDYQHILKGHNYKPMVSYMTTVVGSCTTVSSKNIEEEFEEKDEDDETTPSEDLLKVRKNFQETAFFYPHLHTNKQGEVEFSFIAPENLTAWNFRGFAHTMNMTTGTVKGRTTTVKDFMLSPNLPRYVRTGDRTTIAATVMNLTEKNISGVVTFTLFDPTTEEVIFSQEKDFATQPTANHAVDFTFEATGDYDYLGCRIVAQGGDFSDGEQHLLPVLSDKEMITEAVSLFTTGNEAREFSLKSLFNKNSETATHRKLTVEVVANPAWYAIQALSVLNQPNDRNAISLAVAYYTNSLATYIIKKNPEIKKVFELWQHEEETRETFKSKLEKNRELKTLLMAETPWVLDAASEEEQMKQILNLFDVDKNETAVAFLLKDLEELQHYDGSWSWYEGMPGNYWVTIIIAEAMASLSALRDGVLEPQAQTVFNNALQFLYKEYEQELHRNGGVEKAISSSVIDYLYIVTSSGVVLDDDMKEKFDRQLSRLAASNPFSWSNSLYYNAHSAIVLHKNGYQEEAKKWIESIKQYAVHTDEQGLHFAFNEVPYAWGMDKIPNHVAVMEAMDVVAHDNKTVDAMKLWLLNQKQTTQWDSPVSSIYAICALLQRGTNLLDSRGNVSISIGQKKVETSSKHALPGIGYIKEVVTDEEIEADLTSAHITQEGDTPAWGAVYAQYEEKTDKISHHGNGLEVEKKLYVEKIINKTVHLLPLSDDVPLAIGDKIISRLVIRLDRPMDFVQLKDQRGACFEPIGQLSGYQYNNTVGYYVSVRDASTNFFFNSLSKGVYVLESAYRVSRTGVYQAGIATIQCAYAPMYVSHSNSTRVVVGVGD